MTVRDTTTELLRQDFDLPAGRFTEAELLRWLSARVLELLHTRREYLMSLCYTLDLDEAEVAMALTPDPDAAPHERLALLLYRRQCRRAESKLRVRVPPLTDPNAW